MIKKLREQIKRGQERIKQIVIYNKSRRRTIKKLEEQKHTQFPHVMFDSVDVQEIPRNAPAVAGYVGGKWPTFPLLLKMFPRAWKVPIAISASEDAQCLDVEQGDATTSEAANWVERQVARGVQKPILYCSVLVVPDLMAHLRAAGIERRDIRLWTAHYTFRPHICSPHTCGELRETTADATQWTDEALGRNLDESLCGPHFFKL